MDFSLKEIMELVSLETLFITFGFLVFIDTLTGVIKAWKNGRMKSRTLKNGLFQSLAEMVFMACCIFFSYIMPIVGCVMFLSFTWLNFKEFYSIIENLVEIGFEPPSFLVKGLKKWIDKIDKNVAIEEEKDINK